MIMLRHSARNSSLSEEGTFSVRARSHIALTNPVVGLNVPNHRHAIHIL